VRMRLSVWAATVVASAPWFAPCLGAPAVSEVAVRRRRLLRAAEEGGVGLGPAEGAEGALTPEELLALTAREAQEQEAQLGAAWRQQFEDDVDDLYDWVDRCEGAWQPTGATAWQ
jgi:hypothetical protein